MTRLSTRRPRRAAIPIAVVALVLTGCVSEPMPTPSGSPSASVVPAYVDTYEQPEPTEVAPLRGTTVPAGTVSGPALSAKVDNHPSARPQYGLEHTDIVYEELVEGGMTRYVAIWQSSVPDLIGPVRSIRPMDPDIISPYSGIVAYSGGQWVFVNKMMNTRVVNAIHGQKNTKDTFFRVKGRPGPHDVLVRAPQVIKDFGPLPAPEQGWAFSPTPESSSAAKSGEPVTVISYRFSNIISGTWTYKSDTEKYYRVQGSKADLDNSGNQLTATNIIVIPVRINYGPGVPQTMINGGGNAWVSTGGHTLKVRFSKDGRNGHLHLVDENGFTVQLAAGNTWVELVPLSGSTSYT